MGCPNLTLAHPHKTPETGYATDRMSKELQAGPQPDGRETALKSVGLVLVAIAALSISGIAVFAPRLSVLALRVVLLSGVGAGLAGAGMWLGAFMRAANAERELRSEESEREQLFGELNRSATGSERVARKLAAQVGETLAANAEISSRTGETHSRVEGLFREVADGAAAVAEIRAAVEELEGLVRRQDSVVDVSAAAIEQISASIQSVAEVADGKRAAAEDLRSLTEHGSKRVTETERVIVQVSESMSGINATIGVINDIAERTNLLAMNAAIEAAHAGAAGRGFAVVATEIRKLAETTAKNASEIGATLAELSEAIAAARTASEETGDAFRSIESGSHSVADAFTEITGSAQELASGASEVVRSTEEMRSISAQIVTSAESMVRQADQVNGVLANTRTTAEQAAQSMGGVRESAANVNLATNQISGLVIDTNQHITGILETIERLDGTEEVEEADAIQRLQLSTIILKHMSWVARARAVIDGKQDEVNTDLVDSTRGDLGQWLATEGKTVIADGAAYRRLDQLHRELHALVASIIQCARPDSGVASQRGCTDVEGDFQELLGISRSIVEMLSTYQRGEFVQWTPAIAVNVETFDGHHQKLFDLINRLYKAMQEGQSKQALAGIFDDLLDYTGYHFGTEIRTMEHFGYPMCPQHQVEHRKLVEQAVELRKQLDLDRPMIAVEVMEFLRDWVTNHIKACDKLYSDFFQDKDVAAFVRSLDAGRPAEDAAGSVSRVSAADPSVGTSAPPRMDEASAAR